MLQLALSVPTFTKGVGYYLQDNAFKSVEPEDLYKALQRAADEDEIPLDIEKIMTSWELQSGFPLVTVSRDEENIVTLKQERFFQTNGNTWWIPINYVVGSDPDFTSTSSDLWMEGEHQKTINGSLALKPFTVDDWMIFNIQQTSYYRVNYDNNLWKLLIHQLSQGFEVINVVNRAQLVDDSFSLADADYMTYSIPFGILNYLVNETDYIPWASASRNIEAINSKLTGTRIHSKYQRFIQLIVTGLYNKLGVHVAPDEHKLDRYARIIAINLACKAEMTRCLTDTADELQKMIETNSSLAPDVTASIYCHGLRGGSDAAFMFMLNKMQFSEDPAEREMIIEALGCSQNPSLLRMYMHSAFAPGSPHQSIEKYHILRSVVHNGQLGLELTIEFLTNNHQLIHKDNSQILAKILEHAASYVTTEDQFEKLAKILNLREVFNQELLHHAQKNLDWIANKLLVIEGILNTSSCLKSSILIIISSLTLMFYAQ